MKNKGDISKEKIQVMQQWKKAYIEALIDELHPFGDVLEVGFGHSYAADRIQTYKPKSHIIIAEDPQMVKEAMEWAKSHANVTVIEGSWQAKLPGLSTFDAIFFNDYPIDSDMGMMTRINPEEISRSSSQTKELLSKMENEWSQVKMHYSDQEIDDFYQKTGQNNRQKLPRFFRKLKDYGYITEKQYDKVLQKYDLEKEISDDKSTAQFQADTTFAFLDECLKNHMRKGSRFSSFSKDIISKYEDSQFFENVITNHNLDYFEKIVPIKVPKFSEHFQFDEALVMVVEKFS